MDRRLVVKHRETEPPNATEPVEIAPWYVSFQHLSTTMSPSWFDEVLLFDNIYQLQ